MPLFNELRYALTHLVHERSPAESTVADLVDALNAHGVVLAGRPSKVVSDALRREVAAGRVRRVGRGRYVAGELPGGTKARVRERGLAYLRRSPLKPSPPKRSASAPDPADRQQSPSANDADSSRSVA